MEPGDKDGDPSTEQEGLGVEVSPMTGLKWRRAGGRVGHRWPGSLFLAPAWALALLLPSHKAPFTGTTFAGLQLLRRFG